jgi:hypothetical protein
LWVKLSNDKCRAEKLKATGRMFQPTLHGYDAPQRNHAMVHLLLLVATFIHFEMREAPHDAPNGGNGLVVADQGDARKSPAPKWRLTKAGSGKKVVCAIQRDEVNGVKLSIRAYLDSPEAEELSYKLWIRSKEWAWPRAPIGTSFLVNIDGHEFNLEGEKRDRGPYRGVEMDITPVEDDLDSFMGAFEEGKTMHFSVHTNDATIDLGGSANALDDVTDCVRKELDSSY